MIEGKWVFRGFERGSRKIFLVAVPDRTKNTLISIIKHKILPGSIIHSDCWKAFEAIEGCGGNCLHFIVDHYENFVNPDTFAYGQVHTQNIERTWRDVRGSIPKYGRFEAHYEGYFAEYLFQRAHPEREERLHSFFKAISHLCNPSNPSVDPESDHDRIGGAEVMPN